jgi:hypothetical protein
MDVTKVGVAFAPEDAQRGRNGRRPGPKTAPASNNGTFDQVGHVNRSVKPTSRDRNRSGRGAPDEPGKR